MNRPESNNRYTRVRKPEPTDNRSVAQRDHDRVLYSSAFRRLAGVTQVVAAEEGHVFHNRLTHSLQVAQVARRLAEKLSKDASERGVEIDPDVAEAAGVAHDIGHPPFGHEAEKTLNQLLTDEGVPDGFEGNAQSFRVVNRLSLRFQDVEGLNLTRATLDAILKYPWLKGKGPVEYDNKWGAYDSESDELSFARKFHTDNGRCAEAELMDWADDVTYAVHDAEDFYRAGLIPLERLSSMLDPSERKRFLTRVKERYERNKKRLPYAEGDLKDAFERIAKFYPIDEKYSGSGKQRTWVRMMTSGLIADYVSAVRLKEEAERKTDDSPIHIPEESRREVFILKELTWVYVILNPSLATQHEGQRHIITSLFSTYRKAATSGDYSIFPHFYQEELKFIDRQHGRRPEDLHRRRLRLVADLISGMTEQHAVEMCHRLTGVSLGSVLDYLGR